MYAAFTSNNNHIPGDLETVTQNGATWTLSYDSINLRLLSETHPVGGTAVERILARQYDNLGRPSGFALGTTADPDLDNAVDYDFDTAGRLNEVTSPAGTFTYGFVNQAPHLIASVTGPADMVVTHQWRGDRDALLWKKNEVDSVTVSQFTYSVNPIGQRENVVTTGTAFGNANRGWQWGYDALGQATKAAHAADNTLDRSYAYDSIGNRLQSGTGVSPAAITTYTPNLLNQYSSIENPQSSIVNPVHDLDGNLREDAGINALSYGLKYEWDAENRITAVRKADDTLLVTYTYDPFSRRIRITTTAAAYQGASDIAYLYDGWNVVAEYEITSGPAIDLAKTYTWGIDLSGTLQGAGGVGGLLAVAIHDPQSAIYYPTYDGNGNVSEYIKDDGTTTAHFEYDPFGRLVYSTGTPSLFTYRFSTKPQDFETGLFYYGYRYYDPVTGRWPSRDPIEEEGGINLYGFVGNDSTDGYDYLGLVNPNVPSHHHWLPQMGGRGQAIFSAICGEDFNIDDFTTRMSGVAHSLVEYQFRYRSIMDQFLALNPDCCSLLTFVKDLMDATLYNFITDATEWVRYVGDVRVGQVPQVELLSFRADENNNRTNNTQLFDDLFKKHCGNRKCRRGNRLAKDYQNLISQWRALPRATSSGNSSAQTDRHEDERRRMRRDEDYRDWYNLHRASRLNVGRIETLEDRLARRYPNVVPFRIDVERRQIFANRRNHRNRR